jgi:acetyl esterase
MTAISITERLDPQMAAALAKQAELQPALRSWHDAPLDQVRAHYMRDRAYWNEGGPEMAAVREERVAGPHGAIPVRVYYPVRAPRLPAILYIHGGGWIVGSPDTHDRIMRVLADRSGAAVAGIDYRLSPEHKFPVAHEECVAVLDHLRTRGAAWNLDPRRLAVAGDSAGAHMGLPSCLAFRAGGHDVIRAAALVYGGFGLRDSPSRRLYGTAECGMSAEDLAYYVACLTRTPDDLEDPRFDVLQNDMTGLPPTFIAAAELDPLLDDSTLLAALLARAEVPHRLRVYPGVLHGYLHLGRMVDAAERTLSDAAGWLKTYLSD